MFQACKSLSSFIIPESVASIGDNAFQYCEVLNSITIPENVISIGDYVFTECSVNLIIYGTANSYAQTYATGTMNNQTLVSNSGTKLTKNVYKCTGYTFKGWNTKADGTRTSYDDNAGVRMNIEIVKQ